MLKLLVAMEGRFLRGSDGVYSTHLTYSRLWSRYREVFGDITVLARVSHTDTIPQGWERADGPRVQFHDLPDYHGMRGYLRVRRDLVWTVREAVHNCSGAMLRVPGMIPTLAWQEALKLGKGYALEVVGDPYEALMHTDLPFPFRLVFGRIGARNLRRQCQQAVGAAYVTERVLQDRYPCPNCQTSFSDVELSTSSFVGNDGILERFAEWKTIAESHSRPWRIVFVGSLAQPYKGLEVLMRALATCSQRDVDWRLRILGDGRLRLSYENMAKHLRIAERIEFLGRLPAGEPVIAQLDRSDIFILPSFTEGMPRALLEAMARGLPCVATSVGGIPELLSSRVLVPRGRPDLLSDVICTLLKSPELMKELALSNLKKAAEFSNTILSVRRRQFYTVIKAQLDGGNIARST